MAAIFGKGIKYIITSRTTAMSDTWISHHSETGSSSTGQAINISHVHKIRTYIREDKNSVLFCIVFERGTDSKEHSTSWTFASVDEALVTLARVVCGMLRLPYDANNHSNLIGSSIFRDLAKGFNKKAG